MPNLLKLSPQAVGAFGERAVETELLRYGWIPANVNATVKNAADFDIYAVKRGHTVHLRVRACGPDTRAFQFGGFDPGEQVQVGKFNDTDFTVLVSMSSERSRDQFYVLPSRIVREEIALRQKDYLSMAKRDGTARKDTGHWRLQLAKRKDGRQEGGYGLEDKWKQYLGAWDLLERQAER
jgi:hypothetical protein